MRERIELILKIVCLALAVFVAVQLTGIALRVNPLGSAVIPALPALSVGTNDSAVAPGTNAAAGPVAAARGTNAPNLDAGTNVSISTLPAGTNAVSPKKSSGETMRSRVRVPSSAVR